VMIKIARARCCARWWMPGIWVGNLEEASININSPSVVVEIQHLGVLFLGD